MLSLAFLPGINPIYAKWIISFKKGLNLKTMIFVTTLYMALHKLIGLNWKIVSTLCFFGTKTDWVLFNSRGIVHVANILLISYLMDAPTIFQHFLKRNAWKPSLPGALEDPIEFNAL